MSKYKIHPNSCKCRVCKNNFKQKKKEFKMASIMTIGSILLLVLIVCLV